MNSLLCASAVVLLTASAEPDLTVLEPAKGQPAPKRMLYEHFLQQADTALAKRRAAYEKLETVEDCNVWAESRQQFFVEALGGFPGKTPLNAEVVGTLDGGDYTVEKVLYHSRPQHTVTAAFYRPQGEGPFPAVLIACGHSKNGKAAGYNQRLGITLAKHGIAAMCYDPIGQGERSQSLKEDGTPRHRGSTTEHFLIGVGSILVGTNTAQYRIWDGIRGIDYLVSRPDVDPQKIGCTGCSGGGTLTSYIMALDDRVACAAPACYLTTFERLLHTIGPQDSEQNVFGQVRFGMEQTDYVLMRAPKPTLILASTKDFFDIEGTWDTLRQAKRVYTRYGFPERVNLVESDSGHGVTQQGRESMTRWMRRWLLGIDEPVTDPEYDTWPDEKLDCTHRGQVLLREGEKSVYDLNRERATELAVRRAKAKSSDDELRKQVRTVTGIRPPKELPELEAKTTGEVQVGGRTVEKLLLTAEGTFPLPALRFTPEKASGEAVLYLHADGKHAEREGEIAKLVEAGHTVLAVDLPGIGETRAADPDSTLGDWKNFYMAYLLGSSLVAERAEAVLQSAAWLESEGAKAVRLVAVGSEAGVPALHAAALEPNALSIVEVRRSLVSYANVIELGETRNGFAHAVHGALRVYDLPDLVRLSGENVRVVEPVDARGTAVTSE